MSKKLTQEDKKILLKALSVLEVTIENWSNDYLDEVNKEYKNGSIIKAIDKVSMKIFREGKQ